MYCSRKQNKVIPHIPSTENISQAEGLASCPAFVPGLQSSLLSCGLGVSAQQGPGARDPRGHHHACGLSPTSTLQLLVQRRNPLQHFSFLNQQLSPAVCSSHQAAAERGTSHPGFTTTAWSTTSATRPRAGSRKCPVGSQGSPG